MKRLYIALSFLVTFFLFFSCQKEFSANTGLPGAAGMLPEPVSVTLQGNVLDENGKPSGGVTVQAGIETTTTSPDGYFRIANVTLDKNASLVTAVKSGYFKACRTFLATSGANQVVIKLTRKTLSGTIAASAGGEVALSNGAKVLLPLDCIVRASGGAPYAGNVNVYVSFIDPSLPDINQTVPGSFMADDKYNKRVVLTSYGMLAVELESPGGEKLQLRPEKPALLTFPIPEGARSSAPASLSLWYVDEKTGVWKEEGTAKKEGNTYTGQVKHFSFWNCDFSGTAVKLSMTLKNPQGLPLVYANVQITGTKSGVAHGYTDSLGQVNGLVPSNENLVLEILDECYNVIFSRGIGPFNGNTDLGDIAVSDPGSSVVTVSGKLLDCSGAPVSNGYAIIYLDNIARYAAANDKGIFSSTFIRCSGTPGTCKILGIDVSAQQQGNIAEINLVSPVTNAPAIAACGTSSSQYITYTLDGINYSISDAQQDSLAGYTYPGGVDFVTRIMGTHSQADYISFSFSHAASAGSYPVGSLSVHGYSKASTEPLNVNLTAYPESRGGFYEGNFSGRFSDSIQTNPVHTIDCSFRLRRY